MKLGFFTMPLHPVGRDWRQTLEEDREAVLLAERLGFEEAFIGEHVTDLAETITSCLIFIATLARDTKRIRLRSGTGAHERLGPFLRPHENVDDAPPADALQKALVHRRLLCFPNRPVFAVAHDADDFDDE